MIKYVEELGKVDSADVGYQREGALYGFKLCFDFGGAGQCFGPFCLTQRDENNNEYIPANAFALLKDTMELFNVERLENCVGKICYVLREHERGTILGLRTPDFETNKTLILKDYEEENYGRS